MKKLGKIKLNRLEKAGLEKREMNCLKGGENCGCGCHYSGSGGVTANTNFTANMEYSYHSYGGDIGCGSDPENIVLPTM